MRLTLRKAKKMMQAQGGHLNLSQSKVTRLPEGLIVKGNLDLGGTHITRLPENLIVKGGLDLGSTQITSLPKGLTVGGNLIRKPDVCLICTEPYVEAKCPWCGDTVEEPLNSVSLINLMRGVKIRCVGEE